MPTGEAYTNLNYSTNAINIDEQTASNIELHLLVICGIVVTREPYTHLSYEVVRFPEKHLHI